MKSKVFHPTSEPIKNLRKLQSIGFKSAIIAGGAVRDDYTGEDINDFDIFLWDPKFSNETHKNWDGSVLCDFTQYENYFYNLFSKILRIDELEQLLTSDPENGYAGQQSGDGSIGAHLSAIWEGYDEHNLYQIIFTKVNPVEHVSKYFDIGLCKTYCDGVKIRYTKDFMHDLNNKKLTIVGQDMTQDQFNYVMEYHIEKLEWKYSGFQVEVAPHNQHLLKTYENR